MPGDTTDDHGGTFYNAQDNATGSAIRWALVSGRTIRRRFYNSRFIGSHTGKYLSIAVKN